MPDTVPDLGSWGIDLARYAIFDPPDPFEDHIGPFWFRHVGDTRAAGGVHCVLPTHAAHGNYAGGVHGGAILTLADYALCLVAGRAVDGGQRTSFAMTVSIACQFIDAARIGPPLEGSGEPTQVTGRLAFARGTLAQEGRTVALWSGVCRHVARDKAMARKAGDAPSPAATPPALQVVPPGFGPFASASAYSRHIGAVHVRAAERDVDLIQPTAPHMCNSGGVLHGGYMMSFADTAVTRAARLVTGMAPTTVAFAAEFLAAGRSNAPLETRVEVPRFGKSLAFLRGTVEQAGTKLLSYSATMALRPVK